MKIRTILLGFSALFVAGCAAYFSVLGLSKLFAGASTEVILMASSLEFAKLITAGFLYNYWENINKVLRTYLLIGTIVLITITSAGIYGFLTSAYQTTADQLSVMDKQIELVNLKKERYKEQLTDYSLEREQLNGSIGELSKGLSNNVIQYTDTTGRLITTTSSATRKVLTEQLNDNKSQRDIITTKMDVLNDSITAMDIRALDLQTGNEIANEVGPLKYLAEITGQPMNKIVNWFALFIIFVFDPLAVTLIVAFNTALRVDNGIKDKKRAEKRRTVYGEGEEEEWDGFGKYPKTEDEKEDLRTAKNHADEIELSEDDWLKMMEELNSDTEPNDELKEAYANYVDELKENIDYGDEKNNPPIDLGNEDEDAEALPPIEGISEGISEGVIDKLEKDIDGYVEAFKFNKVISTMSEFYNKNKDKKINKEAAERFEQMITCFAPGFKK